MARSDPLGEIQQHVAVGWAHHRAGRSAQTEVACREALAIEPRHADALYLLGLTLQQRGDHAGAVEWLARATASDPKSAKAHAALGISQQLLGRLQSAEVALRTATELDPSLDGPYNALGVVLMQLGKIAGARTSFEIAVRLSPENCEAQNNLGNLLTESGNFDQAEACYRAALEQKPGFMQARMNLAALLRRLERADEAAECYRAVLDQDPENAAALNDLGALYLGCGRFAEAESCLRDSLHTNPRLVEAACNLAECLVALQDRDEAELWCRRAIELRPDSVEALNTLGGIRRARGDWEGAEASFREALRSDPAAPVPRYNLATSLLSRGDYIQGFELYESRFTAFPQRMAPARKFANSLGADRRWRGQALSALRLLVWCEQGFGDSLMMLRYIPLLKSQGASEVIVVCERELVRFIEAMPTVDRVVSGNDPLTLDDFDLHCPIMSLPHGFKTTLESVPRNIPYLTAPENLGDRWRHRLTAANVAKIGLAWAGSEALDADSRRSVNLSTLAPLFSVTGVQFVSLQKDRRAGESAQTALPLFDWMSECSDFMDTAALVAELDLVISVDTAIAHLAGALGKTVWLLNRFESDWRWGLRSNSSAWYPAMAIFRQRDPDRWADIVQDVVTQLRVFVESRSEDAE